MTQRFLPYTPERDVYRLLGVDATAGTEELLEAWRRLARTFHPDRNGSARAHEEMQVVNAVRDLLTDPQARATYDRERRRWLTRPPAVPRDPQRRAKPDGAARRSEERPMTAAERYARATLAGARAVAAELAPLRCARCLATVGRRDVRCWVCGTAVIAGRAAQR